MEDPYYLIPRSHLPETIRKAVEVTELLQRRKDMHVLDAVREIGISRSAYYKYKDVVRPFYAAVHGRIVTIALTLRHVPGVLSEVLNTLASRRANILTINQSLPLQGVATVIVSTETEQMTVGIDEVLTDLLGIEGVEHAQLVGQS